jgi:hypothetical protein
VKLFGLLKIEYDRRDKLWSDMDDLLKAAVSRAAVSLDQMPSDIDTVAAIIERKNKGAAATGKGNAVATRGGKKQGKAQAETSTLLQSLLGL